jgi:hypothetical protein
MKTRSRVAHCFLRRDDGDHDQKLAQAESPHVLDGGLFGVGADPGSPGWLEPFSDAVSTCSDTCQFLHDLGVFDLSFGIRNDKLGGRGALKG